MTPESTWDVLLERVDVYAEVKRVQASTKAEALAAALAEKDEAADWGWEYQRTYRTRAVSAKKAENDDN